MTESKKEVCYFGVQTTSTFRFPGDDEQFVVLKRLNEGERQQYEDQTGRQVSFDRNSDEVRMDMSSGRDREVLFKLVMVKYKVKIKEGDSFETKEGNDVATWEKLIKIMDGDLAQKFLDAIKELNPWLKTGETDVKGREKKNLN
jgi:hypothetical protein